VTQLQEALLRWYREHGRAELPWRRERSPYRSLISEFMLQQTQVDRVVPKFEAFVERFPTMAALAAARPAEVVRAWRGLGYNTRAVRLYAIAAKVMAQHGGKLPRDRAQLLALRGIGEYTAAAVRAFAYNLDDAPMDTNVRRLIHRLCFGVEYPPKATARELAERARELVPHGKAYDWNSALMDLGSEICTARAPRCLLCPLRVHCEAAPIDAAALDRLRAKHRPRAGAALAFKHTARYARGRIVDRLRELPAGKRISLLDLHRELKETLPGRSASDVRDLVTALASDGLVALRDDEVSLS
jgi:A/G-specific adenine glycosylase